MISLEGKSWHIVTGANAGIGKAIVEGLIMKGLPVVMLCRNPYKALAAKDDIKSKFKDAHIKLVIGDLSDNASVRMAAKNILKEDLRIVSLINNAGIWMTRCEFNSDGIEKTFYVNHLAPFLLTMLLLERLKKSAPSRIINVNAGLYALGHLDLDRTPYGKDFSVLRTYCNSKLANVITMREIAKQLEGTGVIINSLHPGVIRTNLGDLTGIKGKLLKLVKTLWKNPDKGAEPVIYLATSNEIIEKSGLFFLLKKAVPIAKNAQDNTMAHKLYSLSMSLTGLNEES